MNLLSSDNPERTDCVYPGDQTGYPMSDEIESEAPEELRRAQRRQIHAIGASTLSVVAVVAATALGVHAWHGAPRGAGLSSANLAASSPPLTSVPATSEPPATTSDLASDSWPVDSPSTEPSPSPYPSARPTPSTTDSKVSGEITLRLTMTATPTRVEFGQPVRVTVTIVNASRVDAHPDKLGVGTMRPIDTFNKVAPSCDPPQPGGVWCTIGVLRPGQKISLSFSITSASAPFSNDEVFSDVSYVNAEGQQDDAGAQAPELTVLDDPGYLPPTSGYLPPTSPAPPQSTSASPSMSAPPTGTATPASSPSGSASPSITPSAS
jgi:hypothetical protein